jgi:hypothetical protein
MPCSATRCRSATPTSTPTRGGPGGRVRIGRGVVRAGRREAGYGGFTAVVTGLEPGATELVVGVDGVARCIYGEELDLREIGLFQITRASHVEPDGRRRWGAERRWLSASHFDDSSASAGIPAETCVATP